MRVSFALARALIAKVVKNSHAGAVRFLFGKLLVTTEPDTVR
jgi:hypothetical protein